jgi:MFS family permease
MPVFMLLAADMPGFTPATAGLAVGIYGLTQAALQRPFGWLSDRIGRRAVMLAGLALFGAGGVLAALADSMAMLIAGRALQGCGAIAGVALAFAADHTRPQTRGVVMAIIGIAIGASFLLSMVLAVPLSTFLGLRGLFWLTAGLAALGMLLVLSMPAAAARKDKDLHESGRSSLAWLFALSVFLLHTVMTLLFVVLPGMLVSLHGFGLEYHWRIYVPAVIGSVVLVFPLLRRLGKRRQEAAAVPLAFLVMGVALGLMSLGGSLLVMLLFVMVFFLAFNLLEAAMPSVVSQLTGAGGRGQKMGLYTTFQFLGAFAGGLGGGWLLGASGTVMTLSVAGALCSIWAVCLSLWLRQVGKGQQG